MPEATAVRVVEVRAGTSQRPILELKPGEVVSPTSVGRSGMWPLDAPGVLDVHAYVYFDGRVLFMQSADPGNPAKGNGQAIGPQWQQLEIPCTIELGRARLVYRTLEEELDADMLDEDDKTIAAPIKVPPGPPAFRPGAGAFSNRQQLDDESTRFAPLTRDPNPTLVAPLEPKRAPAAPIPKARPAAGAPAANPYFAPPSPNLPPPSSTTVGAPPQAPAPPPPQATYQAYGSVQVAMTPAPGQYGYPQDGMQPGMPGMQQPGMQPGMPGMQPGMPQGMPMQGMPPGMPMQGMQGMPMQGMPQGMPMQGMPPGYNPGAAQPGPPTGRIQTPAADDKSIKALWARTKSEWNQMSIPRKIIIGTFPGVAVCAYILLTDPGPQPVRHHRSKPVASASASSSASAAPSASSAPTEVVSGGPAPSDTETAPPVVATTTTTATTPPPEPTHHKQLKPGQMTLEREAADLAASGHYVEAADAYEKLAKAYPDNAAYPEAARLLRARTTGQ